MSFDFKAAIKEAQESAKSTLVGAIVLGSSGSGKSTLMGTFGVKTLYLYSSGEDHGVKSAAATKGCDIVPICIDASDGKKLDSDEAYARLIEILNSTEDLKKMGIKAIAIDGASELEAIIRGTAAWTRMCATSQGKHNAFAEPTATVTLFRPIIATLKELQRSLQAHFAVSCVLDVKDIGTCGEILEAAPRLLGYSVAEAIVQQFGDVLVVGRMEKGGEVKHKLQFMTEIVKSAKDEAGRLKKSMNFSPRLAGVLNIPSMLDADLRKVIDLKEGK